MREEIWCWCGGIWREVGWGVWGGVGCSGFVCSVGVGILLWWVKVIVVRGLK